MVYQLPAPISKLSRQRGIAATQIVIVMAAMIVVIGLEILGLGFARSMISGGGSESARAYRYAETGARDALVRIARNKSYACTAADCYTLDMVAGGCSNGTGCSTVSVSAGVGTNGDPKIITAKGIVNNKSRTLQVTVIFDVSLNGEISSTTWTEVTN